MFSKCWVYIRKIKFNSSNSFKVKSHKFAISDVFTFYSYLLLKYLFILWIFSCLLKILKFLYVSLVFNLFVFLRAEIFFDVFLFIKISDCDICCWFQCQVFRISALTNNIRLWSWSRFWEIYQASECEVRSLNKIK